MRKRVIVGLKGKGQRYIRLLCSDGVASPVRFVHKKSVKLNQITQQAQDSARQTKPHSQNQSLARLTEFQLDSVLVYPQLAVALVRVSEGSRGISLDQHMLSSLPIYESSSDCSSRCDSLSGGLAAIMPARARQLQGLYLRKPVPKPASLHTLPHVSHIECNPTMYFTSPSICSIQGRYWCMCGAHHKNLSRFDYFASITEILARMASHVAVQPTLV